MPELETLAQQIGTLYDDAARKGFDLKPIPVFDTRHDVVNTLYFRPTGVDRTVRPVEDEELLAVGTYDLSGRDPIARTMLLTLETAVEKIPGFLKLAPDVKCIIPVNAALLHHRETASLFTTFCRSHARHLTSALIFEVVNITGDQAMSHLDEIALLLYPFCLTYSARIAPKTQDLRLYASCNYSGIALDLKGKPWPMKAVGGYFEDLVSRSEQHRLKAYCHGIGSAELADAARQAGIRFLSGPGVNDLFDLTVPA